MFIDLNADCQLLILESLSILELISIAKTNKHFQLLVGDVVRRKCVKKSVTITGLYPSNRTESQQQHKIETNDDIRIKDFDVAVNTLQLFGPFIRSLKIKQYFTPNDHFERIYELITLHCSESLTEIHIDTELNDVIEKLTTPFKMVASVTLNGEFKRLSNAALNFTEIFPEMRCLVLKIVSVADMEWMDQTIRHLEHVDLNVWTYSLAPGKFSEDLTERLFQSNKQIKSLTLRSISPRMLQFVAETLPNLGTLELVGYQESRFDDDGNSCHFEHLKRFSMIRGSYSVPRRITFGRLVEFETDASPEKCKRWITLIENETNLKRITITEYLEAEDFERLANIRSKMEAISVFLYDVEYENIGKFIENNQHLREIKLQTLRKRSMLPIVNHLEERFGNEFTISHNSNRAILLR